MTDLLQFLDVEDIHVLERLREHGEAWIVGGWVRDSLSGNEAGDMDIATTLEPEEVLEIFPRSLDIGSNFGTIGVRLDRPEGIERVWEVTTLREDGGYGDGRRPENVTFGVSIQGDLSRRDFTINAMAIDSEGGLVDPFGGTEDLESGVVRAVGNAEERICEDGLRIVRAFRFLSSPGRVRRMDDELMSAISNNLVMLDSISKERIWSELSAILSSGDCLFIIEEMRNSGVLDAILPGLSVNLGVEMCEDYIVNLALLCSNDERSGQEIGALIRRNLRASNDEVGSVSFLHELKHANLESSDSSIRRFRSFIPESRRAKFLEYRRGIGEDISEFSDSLEAMPELKSGTAPLVNGVLLAEVTGLEPGKRLGRLKAWIHRLQIENDLESVEEVLGVLDSLPWEDGEEEEWPSLSWP